MTIPFPSPTDAVASRAEVLLRYLDYFRDQIAVRIQSLPEPELRVSRVPSGWAPLELLKHLTYVELRWLEWGFEGRPVDDPWGDHRAERWYVAPDETAQTLLVALRERAVYTRALVGRHSLDEVGAPGERWDGADPASLERILLHLIQEYARHVGHLDIVSEQAGGATGE